MPVPADLLTAAYNDADRTIELRRRLHRQPEVGLDLPLTQAAVLEAFADLPVEVHTGTNLSSVVGVLRGARPGPTYLLRADMDALEVHEDTGLPFASEIPGVMHACGHDTHVAMLLGAARLLAERRDELAGSVLFMLQPGEEGLHGARYMLEEGLLQAVPEAPVAGAFAMHVISTLPSGSVQVRPGPAMAAADHWQVTVRGRGGHASMPHAAADPIPVAAEIILALQSMVTRRVDAFDPAVVTVSRIRSGTTSNVIPETAELFGTIRTVSEKTRTAVLDEVRRVAEGIASAHGVTAEVELEPGYPVTVNDVDAARFALDTASMLLGERAAIEMPNPVMGAEDWSYVLQQVPGAMAFLGTRPKGVAPHETAPNHSNRMVLDEDAMAVGIATYAGVAIRWLDPAR